MGHTTDGAVMADMAGNRRHSNAIARWYRWMRLDNGSARSDGRKPLLAQPMLDYFSTFEESFNRFPGFNYEVQGVFQERVDGRIKFFTYVVRE